MIHRYLLHNDQIRDATEPVLTPGQLGLLAGWGIFTTLRVYDGVLFAFERHWERMKRDAERMHVPFLEDPPALEAGLMKLIDANQARNSTLRVVVVRNRGGFWEGPGVSRDSDVIGLTADVKDWGHAVRLGVVPQARHAANQFAGTKFISWASNLTWYEQAHLDGFDEVVLLNERDEVSECTSANIFAAFGNRVFTPPLSSGCLAGVTRLALLHDVKPSGYPVEERVLTLNDLAAADQVFITSTTRELLAVEHIQGLEVRNQGAACPVLQKAFSDYVQKYAAESQRRRSALAPA